MDLGGLPTPATPAGATVKAPYSPLSPKLISELEQAFRKALDNGDNERMAQVFGKLSMNARQLRYMESQLLGRSILGKRRRPTQNCLSQIAFRRTLPASVCAVSQASQRENSGGEQGTRGETPKEDLRLAISRGSRHNRRQHIGSGSTSRDLRLLAGHVRMSIACRLG